MGIQLGSDFDVIVALPLDSRLVVADLTARDAIASGIRYEGMIVYVESEETHFSLKGGVTNGDWVEIGAGTINADEIVFDNTASGLTATDVQDAIDELSGRPVGGAGLKNFFEEEDSNFEGGTLGNWFTDDGTGNPSSLLNLANVDTDPLEGLRAMTITKGQANAQGNFVGVPLKPIDLKHRGQWLYGAFSFVDISGYDPTNALRFEFWDEDNGTALQIAPISSTIPSIAGNVLRNYEFAVFATPTTENVTFRFVQQGVNTSLYVVKVDDFKLGVVDVLPPQAGKKDNILVTDGAKSKWVTPQTGGKNYFAPDDSSFRSGTVGRWGGVGPVDAYASAVDAANGSLDITRYTDLSLNNDRVTAIRFKGYQVGGVSNRDMQVKIYEGSFGNLGAEVISFVIPNANLGTSSSDLAFTWPINDNTFRSGPHVIEFSQLSGTGTIAVRIDDIDFTGEVLFFGELKAERKGGSSALSVLLESTNPRAGAHSLILRKGASNAEDHYFVCPLNLIDREDRGTEQFGGFSFDATDANYIGNYYRVEFWDVTGVPTQLYSGVDAIEILKTTRQKQPLNVSIEANTENVEVRIVPTTNSTTAFDVIVDSFRLGPAAQVNTIYRNRAEIDLASDANITSGKILLVREGGLLNVTVTENIVYPNATSVTTATAPVPSWAIPIVSSRNVSNITDSLIFRFDINSNGTITIISRNSSFVGTNSTILAAGNTITFPVEDNESQVLTENELSQQSVNVIYRHAGGVNFSSGVVTNLTFELKESDDLSVYSGGLFTAPITDNYYFDVQVGFSVLTAGTGTVSLFITRPDNTILSFSRTPIAFNEQSFQLNTGLKLNAGEQVKVRVQQSNGAGRATTAQSNFNHLVIKNNPRYTTLGVVKNYEYLEQTSALTAVASQNVYPSMSGNSITLPPGDWKLNGNMYGVSDGASVLFRRMTGAWSSSNASTSVNGLNRILEGTTVAINNASSGDIYRELDITMPPLFLRVTEPTTVYLNGTLNFASGSNHRVRATIWAERKK